MREVRAIWKNVSTGGEKPYLIRPGGVTSYRELHSLVSRALSAFHAAGVSRGDRLMIVLEDEAKASAAFVASLLAGIVPVMLPFDIGTTRRESIHRLLEPALVVENEGIFSSSEGKHELEEEQDPDQLAYLIFTSGTTSEPSGVEITRRNLFSHLNTLVRLFGFDSRSRVYNPTPVSHTDGLIFGPLLAVATGGTFIRPGPLNLAELDGWIGMLRKHRATHMVTNPTVLSLLDRSCDVGMHFGGEDFRGIISSASLLRPELWRRFEERSGTQLWNLYGLTETVTSALYAGRHPEMGPVGSLGKPIDCEARVGVVSGRPDLASDAHAGELELRGTHIFRGYWKNPGRTAATITPDGWMKTGDLVRQNEDGSFSFLGRVKSVINSGGTLIRGEEVDECLLRHPAVLEAVTVGLGDEDFEEIAVSAVVLSDRISEAALADHCRSELERLKVPKRVIAVDSIPRGSAGKPNFGKLRDLLHEMMSSNSRPDADQTASHQKQVIELAALVFRTEPERLSLSSSPQTVEGWDSFTHINLMLQSEMEFSVRIPAGQVTQVKNLGDLSDLLEKLRRTH